MIHFEQLERLSDLIRSDDRITSRWPRFSRLVQFLSTRIQVQIAILTSHGGRNQPRPGFIRWAKSVICFLLLFFTSHYIASLPAVSIGRGGVYFTASSNPSTMKHRESLAVLYLFPWLCFRKSGRAKAQQPSFRDKLFFRIKNDRPSRSIYGGEAWWSSQATRNRGQQESRGRKEWETIAGWWYIFSNIGRSMGGPCLAHDHVTMTA